jgi:HEPN domain-containing protein
MPLDKDTRLDKNFKDNWVIQSEKDMELARIAKEKEFYEWACYLSQQAAEKAVKSLFFDLGILAPHDLKQHKIEYLSKYVPIRFFKGIDVEEFEGDCSDLTGQVEPSRYPGVFNDYCPNKEYTDKEATTALEQAERIIKSVKIIEGNIGT